MSLVLRPLSWNIQRELHGPQCSLGGTAEQHATRMRHGNAAQYCFLGLNLPQDLQYSGNINSKPNQNISNNSMNFILISLWLKKIIQLQYAYICLCQCYFFQCLVRTNSKCVFSIGWGSHTIVTAGLQHTVSSAFSGVRIPLIDCTIHTTGHYLTVVREPGDGLDPSTVTF